MWQDWINGFLGVWLILLAALGLVGNTVVLLAGIAIAILGFWGAVRNRGAEEDYQYRRDFGFYAE